MVWLAFFARAQPGFDDGEAGLHEHDEEARDQRPHEVDRDLVLADLTHDVADRQPLLHVPDRDVRRVARDRSTGVAFGFVRRRRRRDVLDVGVHNRRWCCRWSGGRRSRGGRLRVHRGGERKTPRHRKCEQYPLRDSHPHGHPLYFRHTAFF